MTRAALRAQAQVDEYPELQEYSETEPQTRRKTCSNAVVHEDEAGNSEPETSTDDQDTSPSPTHHEHSPVRLALRDITDENYPETTGVEVQSQTEEQYKLDAGRLELQEEVHELRKSTRKPRAKAKASTKKKQSETVVVEVEQIENAEAEEQIVQQVGQSTEQPTELLLEEPKQTFEEPQETLNCARPEAELEFIEEISTHPGLVEEEEELQVFPDIPESTTPKFDPAVHALDHQDTAGTVNEDSFVNSITSRSPAKSIVEAATSQASNSPNNNNNSLRKGTPLRRASSTTFEQSFEAMDSLEDSIEQLTADLPVLPAEHMQSPDSPAKVDRRSLRPQSGAATPNASARRTPKSSNRRFTVLRSPDNDKENAPPAARTPLTKAKTPMKSKTPTTKRLSPLKSRTPVVAQSTPHETALSASARKTSPDTTNKQPAIPAIASNPSQSAEPTKIYRKSVVNSNTTKPSTVLSRPSTTLSGPTGQKRPLANMTNTKAEPKKPTTIAEKKVQTKHQSSMSMSFSSSPAKTEPNMHKRRITSGGVLSTSKPGFMIQKSSKPPTASNFQLPGEAIAEKLKAQKEARESKDAATAAKVLAEQKAAKLRAERAAREERVRLNQLKAQEEPNTSTFQLPGAAIAEKLKAQKEARQAQDAAVSKTTLAEQKAAKLRAEREAREERVRLNQLRVEQGKREKEKVSAKPSNMSATLAVSKARAEAAERGRQASKEWAMKKRQLETSRTASQEGVAVAQPVS